MLKTLVKKFKSHSLNEEEQDQQGDNATSGAQNPNADTTAPNVGHHICCQRQENDGFLHPNHDHRLRRHCCHQKQASTGPRNCYPCRREKKKSAKVVSSCDKDSGTESDEELEYIETSKSFIITLRDCVIYGILSCPVLVRGPRRLFSGFCLSVGTLCFYFEPF